MRGRSIAHRLDRLSGGRHVGDREALIRGVAAETGLDPAEVGAELAAIEDHRRRYGPEKPERFVRRCAEELGLAEAEVWDEYARVTAAASARR